MIDDKSYNAKKNVMNEGCALDLTGQDLKCLQGLCGDLWYPHLFFEDFKQGKTTFLARVLPMMRKLPLAWGIPNGVFLKDPHGTRSSEYKALFTALRSLEDGRFEILSAADLPILQLQMVLYTGAHVETPLLPLLLSFFEDVRNALGEDRPGGRKDASRAVLKSFESNTVPFLATVANAQVCPQRRLEMLSEMRGVRLRQARLAATLLGADPGRHTSNLFHKLRASALEDTELDALEALPQASRRYQFLVSPAPLDGTELETVKALFEGCTTDDAYHIEREISSDCPSLEMVARLKMWDFTPPQRASMLHERNLLRVERDLSPDACQELIALFKALSNGCDFHQTMHVIRRLVREGKPDYDGFSRYGRAVLACGFEGEVVATLMSLPLRTEAILPLKGILEGLGPLQKKSVLGAHGLVSLSARTLELVHGAGFDKDLTPTVMKRVWWLEGRGWSAPEHFEVLKCALGVPFRRWTTLLFQALHQSGLGPQGFEAVYKISPNPSLLHDFLTWCKSFEEKALVIPACALMAGKTPEEQSNFFSHVISGARAGYEDVLKWALPTLVELSFSNKTPMVLLSRLVPGPYNTLFYDARRIGPDHLRIFKSRLDAEPSLRQTKLIDEIIAQAVKEQKAPSSSS